jgi:serine/threonine-protein kinase
MGSATRWYRSLAWKFFLGQAGAILVVLAGVLAVAYQQAGRSARRAAGASLSAASQVLSRSFEQEGRQLDAGLEVFTQYSGNMALIEQAQDSGAGPSLADTLVENLPRLGAGIAIVVRPDGKLLACSARGAPAAFGAAGILQMALAPEEARSAGQPGPFYRGFLQVDWGPAPGVYHAVARPLRSPGGAPLGAMLVGRRLDALAAAELRRLAIAGPGRGEPAAHLALLSRFRTLGATLPANTALDALLGHDPGFLAERARLLDNRSPGVLALDLDGQRYLGMLSPLRGVNALDLEMAELLMMPVEPLLAPFRTLQRAILAAGLAGLLLALWIGLRSARGVTAPLQLLVAATEALAEGQPPVPLPPEPGPDEVGALTRAFRSMQRELQAKDAMLAILAKAQPVARGEATLPPPATSPPALAGAPPAPGAPEPDGLPPGLREGAAFAGRYRVDGILGRGGMGVVLKVRDLQLEEDVALKVVRAELAASPGYLERLKGEIRLARRISHRHVLRTHDFGEADGVPFVTMEYLRGTTLRSLLDARGGLPVTLALRIARQVAEGLEAAHAVNVVHRDIKPMNVLFDQRGDVKIMDFGLAVPAAALDQAGPDRIQGTPRYMAPEQVRGEPADARTDLYSLGILLFELCTGAPPFASPRISELLRQHLDSPLPPLAGLMAEPPPGLELLLARLTAKQREERPPSATEVVEALKAIAAGGWPDPPRA